MIVTCLPVPAEAATIMELCAHAQVVKLRLGILDDDGLQTLAYFVNLISRGAWARKNTEIHRLQQEAMEALHDVKVKSIIRKGVVVDGVTIGRFIANAEQLEAIKCCIEPGGRFIRNQTRSAVAKWDMELLMFNRQMHKKGVEIGTVQDIQRKGSK